MGHCTLVQLQGSFMPVGALFGQCLQIVSNINRCSANSALLICFLFCHHFFFNYCFPSFLHIFPSSTCNARRKPSAFLRPLNVIGIWVVFLCILTKCKTKIFVKLFKAEQHIKKCLFDSFLNLKKLQ